MTTYSPSRQALPGNRDDLKKFWAQLFADADGVVAPARGPTIHFEPQPYELIAQCPKCKTVETLQFVEDTLTTSRKFFQKGDKIYHDCGSELPCRLHR